MDEDEVVQPVEETTPEVIEEPAPQEGVDYEVVGDNLYRWKDDGTVTDAEGNRVEEPAAEVTPEPEPEPEPVRTAPRTQATSAPVAQVQQATPPGQPQIYTRDAAKAAIYSDAALAEIADVAYADPTKAERMRADLSEKYQNAVQWIDRRANQVFEQELDELAASAPKAVSGLARQIQRHKEQMTPEQRQQPGAARWAFNSAVAEAISRDPLVAEEVYIRSTTHQNVPKTAPAAPRRPPVAAAPPPVIPKEERTPGPGSARRVPQPRRPPSAATGSEDRQIVERARFEKELHPDWTEEDCMAVARGKMQADENRRAVR